jgi:branched-chain amino acid transport system permease protein
MEFGYLFTTIIKMIALVAWIYGLLWGLNRKEIWQKALTIVLAFGVIQAAFLLQIGDTAVFSVFDQGLLYQAITMTMVALGLNLIYGFNGQFSLAQWGFYGIGAYVAADVTYRWTNGDATGLFVAGIGVVLAALALVGVGRLLRMRRGIPVLSAFTFYIVAIAIVGVVSVFAGRAIAAAAAPAFGTAAAPGFLASPGAVQVVFVLAVLIAGAFAAEVSFLFGLPVLTLGSDYFGIATLGFAIVVQTLMVNSDTILPFPEMKGGRGMIGIPKLTSWIVGFAFLLGVIVLVRNFVRSSTGRATLSVREDETAARAMGIDVAGSKLMAFVLGSFVAGIGGGVYAHYIGFLSPATFSFIAGFNPLIIVVFGGLGSMTGTIAASFVWIFFLEGFLRVLLAQMGTEAPSWRFVLYPVTLLLLMLIRPQGLLGSVEWGFLKPDRIIRRITGGGTAAPSGAAPGPAAAQKGQA